MQSVYHLPDVVQPEACSFEAPWVGRTCSRWAVCCFAVSCCAVVVFVPEVCGNYKHPSLARSQTKGHEQHCNEVETRTIWHRYGQRLLPSSLIICRPTWALPILRM